MREAAVAAAVRRLMALSQLYTGLTHTAWFPRQNGSMKTRHATILAMVIGTASLFACGNYQSIRTADAPALAASSSDTLQADAAIKRLRALGPEGLEALLAAHAGALANPAPLDPQLRHVIDVVAGQRDAHASRLFWHTDLEQAKAEAGKLGRPILSLRLLGRLDEEFSCANSRYFRIALYPNAEINEVLRNEFVLHWQSVRPVPRITIDYGDGRKLERTITGNSAHYVLAPDGQPIEALPGLFGPKAFARKLREAAQLNRDYLAAESAARKTVVRTYHAQQLEISLNDWTRDLQRVRGSAASGDKVTRVALLAQTAPEDWKAIAQLHRDDARLDQSSKTLMRLKNPAPAAAEAGRIAVSKAMVEDPMLRAMREFEWTMAEDSVRNQYALHTQIHDWFAQDAPQTRTLARLNEHVYANLFLMPSWDPWLGLRPQNGYSGLEADGAALPTLGLIK
jgi:hypothetical protein